MNQLTTDQTETSDILVVDHLSLHYGAVRAVDDVSLRIAAGSRHALIGPNGAGKSSLFSVLAGATPATAGSLTLDGQEITTWNEVARARAGLLRTYQHSSLFVGLSVIDNIRLAVERIEGRPLRPWPSRRDRKVTERALQEIERVGLTGRRDDPVSALSHGERRQLEVALVLACDPLLVLFDEPTAGMSAAETHRFAEIVEGLPRTITTIIVEHDLDVVFRLADRITCLAAGRLIAEGSPDEIRSDEAVNEAYLGTTKDREPLFFDSTPTVDHGSPADGSPQHGRNQHER